MTNENTSQEDTSSEEEVRTEEETQGEESTGEDESSSTQIDYEKEIEEEEKRGKPDPKKAAEAFKKRHEKKQIEEEPEETGDKRYLTQDDLDEILTRDRMNIQKDLLETTALTYARSLTSNESEAKLILAKWRNRSFPPELPLQEQIEEMYGAVNRKKLMATNSEMAAALKSKGSISKETASAYRDPQKGSLPKMAPQDSESYKRAGFEYDTSTKFFKKKLPSGKFLMKDPISKRTWIV